MTKRIILGIVALLLTPCALFVSPLFWIGVAATVVCLVRSGRSASAQGIPQTAITAAPTNSNPIAIQATPEMIEDDREQQRECRLFLVQAMDASGYFISEKVPWLLERLCGEQEAFARVGSPEDLQGESVLSLEEKRTLQLNTRMKYSRDFIACFHVDALSGIEPKSALRDLQLSAFHKASRRAELQKLRRLRIADKVEIQLSKSFADCAAIKACKKVWPIDQIPELPLKGCDSSVCMCWFSAVISERLIPPGKRS